MPQAQVAAGHYLPDDPGDSAKFCVNVYPEKNDADSARPVKLVRRVGSLDLIQSSGVTFTTVRGMGQADGHASGKVLIIDGTTVRTYDTSAATFGTLSGTVAGSDRAQFAFAEVEAGILANGDFYVSTGSAVAAATDADWATLLSDHSETDFTSVSTLGQRALLTYGSRFAFSDALDFNQTTTLNYYTAESAPDGIVAGHVLGDWYYVFGTQTIEIWTQTGDNDDPFRPLTSSVIQRGCLARDTIRLLDNTLFFVADDYTVRRLGQGSADIISQAWVTRALRSENKADLIASTMEYDNHTFYIINGLNNCLVYSVAFGTWQLFASLESDTWKYAYILDKDGTHYGLGRTGTVFGELSRSFESDEKPAAGTFGNEVVWQASAHLPITTGRPSIKSIRVDGTKGVGSAADAFDEGYVESRISRDNGNTWSNWRRRSTGTQGVYDKRTIWRRNGRGNPPQTIIQFRGNDMQQIYGVSVNDD